MKTINCATGLQSLEKDRAPNWAALPGSQLLCLEAIICISRSFKWTKLDLNVSPPLCFPSHHLARLRQVSALFLGLVGASALLSALRHCHAGGGALPSLLEPRVIDSRRQFHSSRSRTVGLESSLVSLMSDSSTSCGWLGHCGQ